MRRFRYLLAAVALLPVAQAQTWSTVASTCEPGSDSIGRYAYSNGTFEFAGTETGLPPTTVAGMGAERLP